MITSIKIENIKGIKDQKFETEIFPNKPNILVAPNGFGKSSIAIAFASLRKSKIKLNKDHYHGNQEELIPRLLLTVKEDGEIIQLEADDSKNEISHEFDVFVINSQLIANAKKNKIHGNTIVSSSMDIATTTLIQTIPQKVKFMYTNSSIKSDFGKNGKILRNIDFLLKDSGLMSEIIKEIDFTKFKQKRIAARIEKIVNKINNQIGTANSIRTWINQNILQSAKEIEELKKLSEIIAKHNMINSDVESFLSTIQIIMIYKNMGADFRKAINYLNFSEEKIYYEELINSLNTTRFKIRPVVDQNSNSLVIRWPKAHEISNGQRDVLSFITLLMKAKRNFRKEKCLLIIDEIFDYLDDANLISFQYFISNMIEEMKDEHRSFYPILLTHLDPSYFNHFSFNSRKMKVNYLKEIQFQSNSNILKLIRNRENPTIKEDLSKYFLHFHFKEKDITGDFKILKLPIEWGKSEVFRKVIRKHVNSYLEGNKSYDPIAICIGVRTKIEELLFKKINEEKDKIEFLENQNGTKNKLSFCEDLFIQVPEIYYLLGVIYNDTLHVKGDEKMLHPVAIKLENVTIRKIISDIFKD